MRINNNLSALTAFTSLNTANKSLNKAIATLSTGLRINSSADDAAGFAVSEGMRSQISGLGVAMRNSQDGISLLQTAEGALGETNSMLQRMRELALQASSDTLTSQDRQYLQAEIDELRNQVDRIANTTEFNRKKILDGSCGAVWSASDSGVSARIHGGLVSVDEFGQKVNHEGNYRIEVSAEPGLAQVQKSNIFNLDVEEYIERIEYVTVESKAVAEIDDDFLAQMAEKIDIEQLTAGDSGKGWSFDGQSLTLEESGSYAIVGTNQQLTDRNIKVSGLAKAIVYMSDVNISVTSGAAFELEDGAGVEMYLNGSNYLSSGEGHAGIEAPKGTALSISSIYGAGSINGTLEVHGGDYGAGIGGTSVNSPKNISSGAITLNGGTVKAYGGNQSAGIGGASSGNPGGGGDVTITGGDIEAYGGKQGAGIGSGHHAENNTDTIIKIAGGTIRAYGGVDSSEYNGAGIGGGCHSNAGKILIKSGLVQWLDKDNGIVDPNSYPVFAQKGGPQMISAAQDIGHGTSGKGSFTEVDGSEFEDIPITSPVFPTKRIPVTITDVTVHPSNIRSIKSFYNSEGVFLVDNPQTLTISQGNGKTTQVTLYDTDSMYDVADKINNAISEGLGQGVYSDNQSNFCTIAAGSDGTSESVCVKEDVYRPKYQRDDNGNLVLDENNKPIVIGSEQSGKHVTFSTMLVRSAIPGKDGELSFSGDPELLQALGLNTIQDSSESTLTASVYDAHTEKVIASNVKGSGSGFVSLIPPEIDIEVDSMVALSANWDEHTKRFILTSKNVYSAFIHLKNNGTIFQTGANSGEDFSLQLADSSSSALGLSRVNVLTRENASRSISILDRAINAVSSQRAKIGSYSNALEHSMNDLTTCTANLTHADSRLRDADMAYTMMDFVKCQILSQSGTAMLSQANQLPQSVLSLIGN